MWYKVSEFSWCISKFVDDILAKSFAHEGTGTCIKNTTIGFTDFDKLIKGIEDFNPVETAYRYIDEIPKINKQDIKEIYCNEYWFIIYYKDGNIDKYINSNDERAEEQYKNTLSLIDNPKVYVKR